MTEIKKDFICIAQIGHAHGIKGLVHVTSYTENTDLLLTPKAVCNQNGENFIEIDELSPHKNGYLAKIKGVKDRTSAEKLCHEKLYVPRSSLPDIREDDSFYYVDLIGLPVFIGEKSESFGEIISVQNFGASDLLEIKPTDKKESFYIPFTKSYVPNINIPEKRVTIFLPDGFFSTSKQEA